MSILLESLNQSKSPTGNSPDNGVPSVDDSHFDDEMLSDEWLLKKLLFWKSISGILLLVLFASWTGFYFYSPISINKVAYPVSKFEENETIPNSQEQLAKEVEHKESSKLEEDASSVFVDEQTNIENTEIENEPEKTSSQTKEKYQPKKIAKASVVAPAGENVIESQAPQNNLNQTDQVVEFGSLTEIEKQELPELEISSYAVSNNPEKSFVVLNGAFYGQGETIAPHLILISIDKEGIILRYKGKMIRKKYSL